MRSAIRSRMTHRVTSERDARSVQQDAFGQPVTSLTQPLSAHPCYWQGRTDRYLDGGGKLVALGTHMLLVPIGTDIAVRDRVTGVTDRRGRALQTKRLRVVGVGPPRENHVEVAIEEYD